jgi:hypothetical protein
MEPERSRLISLRLQRTQLETRVHELAHKGVVYFSDHALDRMDLRGISDVQAVRVLASGELRGEPEPGNRPGEWKVKMVARMKGMREIGVVSIIVRNSKIFVKTVEWEDMR